MSHVPEQVSKVFTATVEKVGSMMERLDSKTCYITVAAATTVIVGFLLHKRAKKNETRRKIAQVNARRSRQQRELQLLLTNDNQHELVTEERQKVLDLNFTELRDALRSHTILPSKALDAYMARALEITLRTNCVCFFLTEARSQAELLDQLPPDQRGPLHGLPLSVKECFMVQGQDFTAGLSKFLDSPASRDASIVSALRSMGALPFCTTNVPQTMKCFVCSNPIYGQTTHPLDPLRAPGGSTGGEACLMAAGGSVLGLGTDLSGSVRQPAHISGVCGLKPTSNRIYNNDRRQGSKGQIVGVTSATGLMSPSTSAIVACLRLLLTDPYKMMDADCDVVPLKWNEDLYGTKRKLKIGYYECDQMFPLTPGCRRALQQCVQVMREEGHELVLFEPPNWNELFELTIKHVLADGGANVLPWLENDLIDSDAIGMNMLAWKTPGWLKRYVAKPIYQLFISEFLAKLSFDGPTEIKELWVTMGRIKEIRREFLKKWNEEQIDVLLAPVWATPATFPKGSSALTVSGAITGNYNALDFPAGVVPFTRVTEEDETRLMNEYPKRDLVHRVVRQSGPGSRGLPMGVQVVGKPYQEEMVLHAMELVEGARDRRTLFQRKEREAI